MLERRKRQELGNLTTAIICVSRFSPNALWISRLRVNMGTFMEGANNRRTEA